MVDRIVVALEGDSQTPILAAASSAGRQLVGVEGFGPPSWQALSLGARPPVREPDAFEHGAERHGWQHEASSRVEREHRERRILPRLVDNEKAMLRSQSGPGAGLAFSATPSNSSSRIEPHLFRVLLLRRLRLPLPLVSRTFLMWLSNRRAWPPSRSVRKGRSVGETGLRSRERRSQNLPRRWRQSIHQRDGEGYGLG